MTNYCNKCGTPISEGDKVCPNCGRLVENVSSEKSNQNNNSSPYKPHYGQTQPHALTPKRSNNKIIIGVIAIITIIIIVALLSYIFLYEDEDLSKDEEKKIIGTWELESETGDINGEISTRDGNGTKVTFKSDNTYKISYKSYYINDTYQPYSQTGKWKIENGKLCIMATSSEDNSDQKICYNYALSNNNKKLTLNHKYSSADFYSELTQVFKKI